MCVCVCVCCVWLSPPICPSQVRRECRYILSGCFFFPHIAGVCASINKTHRGTWDRMWSPWCKVLPRLVLTRPVCVCVCVCGQTVCLFMTDDASRFFYFHRSVLLQFSCRHSHSLTEFSCRRKKKLLRTDGSHAHTHTHTHTLRHTHTDTHTKEAWFLTSCSKMSRWKTLIYVFDYLRVCASWLRVCPYVAKLEGWFPKSGCYHGNPACLCIAKISLNVRKSKKKK